MNHNDKTIAFIKRWGKAFENAHHAMLQIKEANKHIPLSKDDPIDNYISCLESNIVTRLEFKYCIGYLLGMIDVASISIDHEFLKPLYKAIKNIEEVRFK